MSDFGKIHRKAHHHRKVIAAGNAAFGLWSRCNSWCRDNRSAGYITAIDALDMGTQEEIDALVRERLWVRTQHGYRFHDYEDWNNDIEPDTVAGDLVRQIVPESHPSVIRKQLARQAAQLIAEGIDQGTAEAALKLWLTKDLSPSLLPALASEAMKDAQRNQSLLNLMRDCYRSGAISPLKAYGFVFTPPDLPAGLGEDERRACMLKAKRDWLVSIQKESV